MRDISRKRERKRERKRKEKGKRKKKGKENKKRGKYLDILGWKGSLEYGGKSIPFVYPFRFIRYPEPKSEKYQNFI